MSKEKKLEILKTIIYMMRTFFLCIFLLLVNISVAQENLEQQKIYKGNFFIDGFRLFDHDDFYFFPALSVEFQALKNLSANIGFGVINYPEPHSMKPWGGGIFFNNEFTFKNKNQDFIYAPQLSVFYNYSFQPETFIALYTGVRFAYHTNFKNGYSLQLAPEIGMTVAFVSITYSRNIAIRENDLIPVNENNINIKIVVPISTIYFGIASVFK